MKSYKLREVIETSLYSIENQLVELSQNLEESWDKSLWNIFSVIFGGVGTSLLFIENAIPALINTILVDSNETIQESKLTAILLYLLVILIIFICLTGAIRICVYGIYKVRNRSNKNTKEKREVLVRYFHKVILNNIFVGISFVQKYLEDQKKLNEMQNISKNESNQNESEDGVNYEEKIKLFKDNRMYLYEAKYYFVEAKKGIDEHYIFELDKNRDNDLFLSDIGYETLFNMLEMYDYGCTVLQNYIPAGEEKDKIVEIRESIGIWINRLKRQYQHK